MFRLRFVYTCTRYTAGRGVIVDRLVASSAGQVRFVGGFFCHSTQLQLLLDVVGVVSVICYFDVFLFIFIFYFYLSIFG